MAATGVGAGDVVAASVAGARYGVVILWAALAGALAKYVLNEGVARWQLATGTTLLEGWFQHLPRPVLVGFGGYLVLWSFMVAGAMMAACGLAAHAMFPSVPVGVFGAWHAVVAAGLVLIGRYALFERLVKVFIALLVVTVVGSALLIRPDVGAVMTGLAVPSVPAGAGPFLLGVIGGVGGSVTLLSYSYWMRERGWDGPTLVTQVRLDLRVAYGLTGVFGVAIMVLAAQAQPDQVTGAAMALELARQIGQGGGAFGQSLFLVGFWGAVFTSMLGVWQGVPYLFADFVRLWRGPEAAAPSTTSAAYRLALLFLAGPPMVLLLADRPVWIVVIYSVAGAFFMPFLAGTLLYLNTQARLGALRSRWGTNALLVAALVLFGYLCVAELVERLGGG